MTISLYLIFCEVIPTVVNLAGIYLNARSKRDADLDRVCVIEEGINGKTLLIADKNVRIETLLLVAQILILIANVSLLSIAPPPFISPEEFRPLDDHTKSLIRQMYWTIIMRAYLLMALSGLFAYLSYKNWLTLLRVPTRSLRAES